MAPPVKSLRCASVAPAAVDAFAIRTLHMSQLISWCKDTMWCSGPQLEEACAASLNFVLSLHMPA